MITNVKVAISENNDLVQVLDVVSKKDDVPNPVAWVCVADFLRWVPRQIRLECYTTKTFSKFFYIINTAHIINLVGQRPNSRYATKPLFPAQALALVNSI